MKDLKETTVRGGFAKAVSQAANVLIRLGSLMVLARVLDPPEFGLVAMVTAVTGIFNLFRDAGLSMVTIQRATITEEQLSTLFWINMLVGALFAAASAAMAPVLVVFYREPRLLWVTVACATGFLLNAPGVQHSALLQRQMRFPTLALIDTVSQLIGSTVGILMALAGLGYWALVGMALALPASTSIGVWLATGWVPGRPRRGVGAGSMLRFGGTFSLNALVIYVAYNLDKVLLGRRWGADALGLYGRAFNLVNIVTDNFNSSASAVALSGLSRLQDDPERLRSYFLKGYALVLSLTLPVTLACAVLADDIIVVVLGRNWTDAAPLLRLLAPTILAYSLINPPGWLLYSTGGVMRGVKMAFVMAPVLIVAYWIGLPYGPAGVASGYSVAMVLLSIPMMAWAVRDTPVSLLDLWKVVRTPLVSSIAAAVAGFAAVFALGASTPPLRLLIGGSVLVTVYIWVLLYPMGQKAFYVNLLHGLAGWRPVGSKVA